MAKEMLINVSEGEECRIALLEDGKLEELYMERTSSTSHVGNIYKGRVTNVEPSIQAAFVDFGLGRNGFLHISDLMPSYFGRKGEEYTESVGRKMARRDRPPIQRCLRRGDDITVQIIKEGIGTKGPTLTTYLSVPGRILVMMPGMSRFGISRKIEDEEERRRLRGILDSLKPIDEVGFIIRTAGVGKNKTEIERDLKYLTRLWENIQKKLKQPGPQELYTEGDLVTRTVRDVYSSDIDQIVVDNKDVAKKIKEFFKIAMPRTKNKVELYEDPIPLFHKHNIEREIEQMYSRHVALPSGGSLVIDSTEAIVAIDVNSGKFRDHSDAETTAFKTDLEAADEIPRQLRLRDLGGVIICDFIDLRFERHRRELEARLHDNLKNDRAKTKVLRMSQFGIIEMTRQRMRPSLKRSIYFDCPHCKGSGLVKTPESMSLDVMRKLAIAAHDDRVSRVELTVCPDVAFYLLNRKRLPLAELEAETKKRVAIRPDAQLGLDEVKLSLFDSRDGLVFLDVLGMSPQDDGPQQHGGRPPRDNRRGGRRDDRRNQPPNRNQRRDQHPEQPEDERFEMESAEDAVDQREQSQEEESSVPLPAPAIATAPSESSEKRSEPEDGPEESDNVIDVEEGYEPMGEAPQAIDDDRNGGRGGHNRRRGRRGRGRGGQDRGTQDRANQNQDRGHQERANQDRANQDRGGNDRQERVGQDRQNRGGQNRGGHDQRRSQHNQPSRPQQHSQNQHPQNRPAGPQRPPAKVMNEVPPVEEAGNVDELHLDDEGPQPGNERHPSGGDDRDNQDGQQKRRRRRRGGRRHRRNRDQDRGDQGGNGPTNANGNNNNNGPRVQSSHHDDDAGNRAAPQRVPPPRASEPPPPVVRTGSTDKHLVHDDVPIDPEPPRRPRSHRDLDAIPDDMD